MLHSITSTGDRLFRFINITLNDPEPPKKGFLKNFSRFQPATHNSRVTFTEMAGDKSRQPAHEIFSIKRKFQESKSRLPGPKEACAGGHQRWQPPR